MAASDSARVQLLRALDHDADFRTEAAIGELKDLWTRQPGYTSAHLAYITLMRREGRRIEARREYHRRGAEREMRCWAEFASLPANGPSSEIVSILALAKRDGVGACMALLLPNLAPGAKDLPGLPPLVTLARRGAAAAPDLAAAWVALAQVLTLQGDSASVDAVLDSALANIAHPLERLMMLAWQAGFLGARGKAREAEARWQALDAAVDRDARPGLRYSLYSHYRSYPESPSRRHETTLPPHIMAKASLGRREGEALSMAFVASGRADYARALPHFRTALAVADSMPDGQNAVVVRIAFGRVLSKMGRLAEAEWTLREAQRIAVGTNQRYSLADTWHNLSHTYEGQRAMSRALMASDSFVAYAAKLDHDPIRIMSRHDAGLLRLSMGMHAAAHVHFEAMVRLIDAEHHNHYWAGEYYERIGNPRSAQRFYSLGARLDPGERSLNYAGLARVYSALGLPDSAAAAARVHDAASPAPTDVPLEAEVLARLNRRAEAVAIARRSAAARERSGNVQGAALGRLQAARLSLEALNAEGARDDLKRANDHIAALALRAERVEALRLEGRAALIEGNTAEAARVLREASRQARASGDSRMVRDVETALGDALATSGDVSGAMRAYERATAEVTTAAASFTDDIDRARYRATHMGPYDAAIRLALRQQDPQSLARWSVRRKAAALLLASRSAVSGGVDLVAAQRALRDDEALLDYQVLPEQVAVLVVRRNGVRIVPLPTTGDSVSALTRRLTVGFRARGRSVDLARARFDTPSAVALHEALFAPLRSALTGVARITVIPDASVFHVPFAALVTSKAGGARPSYLVEEFQVDYALSLSMLGGLQQRWSGSPMLLMWADVPGVNAERASVRTAWTGAGLREIGGAGATESALARALPASAILHFAVHAEASDRNPLATHLQLAPDGATDGLLHVGEIASTALGGKLVVLAACESLVGPLVAGEGFMGLARAFLAAGASGVVATRWPVDATSARFSDVFYRELARGAQTGSAMRDAQLSLLRAPATSHPFYWAGYTTVVGARATAP